MNWFDFYLGPEKPDPYLWVLVSVATALAGLCALVYLNS